MAKVNLSGTAHPATAMQNMLTGALGQAQLTNPLMNANTVTMRLPTMHQTLVVRYEQAENGWIVYIAKHEGENFKRYIAATLNDAHMHVSAYIAEERLER